jgi:hypothetical protein
LIAFVPVGVPFLAEIDDDDEDDWLSILHRQPTLTTVTALATDAE